MELQNLRRKIDEVDSHIVRLLTERLTLVEHVGKEKKRQRMEIVAREREKAVLQNVRSTARQLGLGDKEIGAIETIYHSIIAEAVKLESDQRDGDS